MRESSVFLVLVLTLSAGCAGGAVVQRATSIAEAPSPTIGPATYRAVLASVFDELESEARTAATERHASSEEARLAADPFLRPKFASRMRRAMRAHGVTAEQMAEFARDNPATVGRENRLCAARMRAIRPVGFAILRSAEPDPDDPTEAVAAR